MQLYLSLFFYGMLVVLTGCAAKPINSFQTINGLQIPLNKTDSNVYKLVSGEGRTISIANGRSKSLVFLIPHYINLNQCFSVVDKNGDNFLPDKPRFTFSLMKEYRALVQRKRKMENYLEENGKQVQIFRNLYSLASSAQMSNRAFINGLCVLPSQKPLPSKPITKCETYDKCFDEGKSYCSNRFFMVKICTTTLGWVSAQLFSRPFCKFAEAQLFNQIYEMEDLLGDAGHGFQRDIQGAASGGLSFFYHTYNEYQNLDQLTKPCVDSYVETQYNEPIRRWQNIVKNIIAEPEKTRSKCFLLESEKNRYAQQVQSHEEEKVLGENELNILNVEMNDLENKRLEIAACN